MDLGPASAAGTEARIHPLREVTHAELAKLVGRPLRSVEQVRGGLTNTLHKVVTDAGAAYAVKHYASGREAFDAELATLTLLHGTLPVPAVVHADAALPVIVYHWVDGITLQQLRTHGPADGFASIADQLGRLLAELARTDATEPYELTSILERTYTQLIDGRARGRIGATMADAIYRGLTAREPELAFGAVCLAHGDLGHRNVIVHKTDHGTWEVSGLIDWEGTTTSSPLQDVGSLFRDLDRYDPAFVDSFARGYRAAGGQLPDNWLLLGRLLDATWLVDALDDERIEPALLADCRRLLTRLVDEMSGHAGPFDHRAG